MKSAEQLADLWINSRSAELPITKIIQQIQAEAYEAGQRDMREAAARTAEPWATPEQITHGAGGPQARIRALPIKPMTESSTDA